MIRALFFTLVAMPLFSGPMEDTFGASARNKAMGGAGLSIAEDYSATFYNPSLLALCRGSRLSMGYDYIHTSLNDADPEADQLGNYSSMNLGFCLKPLNQVGIGVYSNFSMGPIEFSASTLNKQPAFIMYGGDLKAFSMMIGAGYSPMRQLAVGIAMSLASGVYLGTDLNIQPSEKPPVVAKFPAQISPIVGIIAGVTVIPMEDWRLSLSYRSSTYGKINIVSDIKLSSTTYNQAIIEGLLSYSPHQFALGSSYLIAEKWLLSADATYYLWSKYEGPYLRIRTTETSPIAPGITVAGIVAPNFSNIIVPRAGVEYSVWDKVKLRAGYSYRLTPAPVPAGQLKLLDANAHRISTGAGYEFQLYQNIFLTADAFFAADILQDGWGSAFNTGVLIGAEYD